MQANKNLLGTAINTPIFKDIDFEKDLLPKKANPNNSNTDGEDKVVKPSTKVRAYPEPIIQRSVQKDRIEIW